MNGICMRCCWWIHDMTSFCYDLCRCKFFTGIYGQSSGLSPDNSWVCGRNSAWKSEKIMLIYLSLRGTKQSKLLFKKKYFCFADILFVIATKSMQKTLVRCKPNKPSFHHEICVYLVLFPHMRVTHFDSNILIVSNMGSVLSCIWRDTNVLFFFIKKY